MDADLERALAASRREQADLLEEDRQLEEAIRLSKLPHGQDETSSTSFTAPVDATAGISSFPNQLGDANEKLKKRKAEDELPKETIKAAKHVITIAYPNGGIRITRTPGRNNSANCINLVDIVHKDHLVSACIFSFFIANEDLFQYLPLSHLSNAVPIYIGRDVNMDPMLQVACTTTGISLNERGKLTKAQLATLTSQLGELHRQQYGKNYHSFYAWSPGSSHSKIMLLVYPAFLRIVITSCNMMDIDTEFGDNHWYIHDVPKQPKQKANASAGFETDLLAHLQHLGTPEEFVDSIRGLYDYSTVKVNLVTSVPGVCAGNKAERHGLLRLRRVLLDLELELLGQKGNGQFQLEVCTASVGDLNAKWLTGFYDCALGKEDISISNADNDYKVPDFKLFYPTVGDVKSAHELAQEAASNIGCHTRPWNKASDEIKNLFHHYESKDRGRLFHQKLILAYDPSDKMDSSLPYYIYLGSANLSQSAWGGLEKDKKKNKETCDVKLVKMNNFECGVVIPGQFVPGLLARGTTGWREGVVPYVQNAARYDIAKDRPWNDPRWVTGYKEGNGGGTDF